MNMFMGELLVPERVFTIHGAYDAYDACEYTLSTITCTYNEKQTCISI